jgi:hypothetical protein
MTLLKRFSLAILALLALIGIHTIFTLYETPHERPRWDFGEEVDWDTIPPWNETNAPPLAIEEVLKLARNHVATEKNAAKWSLRSVSLAKGSNSRWYYEVLLEQAGGPPRLLRILMNHRVGDLVLSGKIRAGAGDGPHHLKEKLTSSPLHATKSTSTVTNE